MSFEIGGRWLSRTSSWTAWRFEDWTWFFWSRFLDFLDNFLFNNDLLNNFLFDNFFFDNFLLDIFLYDNFFCTDFNRSFLFFDLCDRWRRLDRRRWRCDIKNLLRFGLLKCKFRLTILDTCRCNPSTFWNGCFWNNRRFRCFFGESRRSFFRWFTMWMCRRSGSTSYKNVYWTRCFSFPWTKRRWFSSFVNRNCLRGKIFSWTIVIFGFLFGSDSRSTFWSGS